jgi:hypothetical protein
MVMNVIRAAGPARLTALRAPVVSVFPAKLDSAASRQWAILPKHGGQSRSGGLRAVSYGSSACVRRVASAKRDNASRLPTIGDYPNIANAVATFPHAANTLSHEKPC